MPIRIVPSNDFMGESPPPASAVPDEIPAWLAARRDRHSGDPSTSAEPLATPSAKIASIEPLVAILNPPPVPRSKNRPPLPVISVPLDKKTNVSAHPNWFVRWLSRQTMISILVSLALHSTVLLVLAFIMVSHATQRDVIALWGVAGDADQSGEDMVLDTTIANDAGESGPIQMPEIAQTFEALGPAPTGTESMRVGLGGKGNGDGDSGNGSSMGVSSLRIPGHAQTKGSFSAWADPRDPKPGQEYFIVIQVKLPRNVKKYKGSDLTGSVKGTDNYKQEIRFKMGEQFPVEEGAVQIRIRVPGAARLVRDTIHIESKLLREKQDFEIEF